MDLHHCCIGLGSRPRATSTKAERTSDFKRYIVLEYMADDHNVVAFQMGTVENMLRDVQGFDTLPEAVTHAQKRMPGCNRLEYEQLPGIIKSAFVHGTRGSQPALDL